MFKKRYLTKHVAADLAGKMVFIGGPRQVGKTTLSTGLLKEYFPDIAYFLWDNRQDRKNMLASDWPGSARLLVLDELHKMKGWKGYVKGEYDKLKDKYKFLVTGSARLDIFRKGGDSLQGRYHYYRLHPFTLAETLHADNAGPEPFAEPEIRSGSGVSALSALDKFGGFPEAFAKQDETFLRRWHNERVDRLFREDIRDVEVVRDISSIQLLGDMLPERAAGLLSVNSLREDLNASHGAVSRWLELLETFYYIYRIYPYSTARYKAMKKEPKVYLWDWSEVGDPGARFENLVASHLLKLVHFLRDRGGFKAELNFLRGLDRQREVDFIVSVGGKPWFSVEAKLQQDALSPNLAYFRDKLSIPYNYQVVGKKGVDRLKDGVRIISADRFLAALI
ncbi:MAG TPA: ATP-binding protein [Elusimicrobiales bacterium]|nr:ATP-binding protein [Elusimicrobiales bacterium]